MDTVLIIIAIVFDLLFIIPIMDTVILYIFDNELIITKNPKEN